MTVVSFEFFGFDFGFWISVLGFCAKLAGTISRIHFHANTPEQGADQSLDAVSDPKTNMMSES